MNNSKISAIFLWGLLLGTVAVLAVFFLGGSSEMPELNLAPELWKPTYTDLLLNWGYIVLGVGVLSTLGFALVHFTKELKDRPMDAVKSLAGLVGVIAMFFICWSLGSGETLTIPGYDGKDNVYFWLKWTDMLLFSAYFILACAIGSVVVFGTLKVVKK
ncbi:hypothetical protein MASR1M31_10630 [Porphyromonadaceae bacterium]